MGRLAPGDRLGGDLTLVERRGEEGPAETWLARDRARGVVVVRVLGPDAPDESKESLEREFALARRLDHPSIVRVLGFVREGDHAWLTEERMPGGDARRLRGAPPAEVSRALLPVVDALVHAHARGVAHRDVRPSNVLLDAEGRGRLAGFGRSLEGGREASGPADDVKGLGALVDDLLAGQLSGRLGELVAAMRAEGSEDRPGLAEVRQALLELQPAPLPRSRPEVVLQPPPRAETVIRPVPLPREAPRALSPVRPARPVSVAVLTIGGGLLAAAVVVFGVLPRWVASRPEAATAPSPATEATALPSLATPEPTEPAPDRTPRPPDRPKLEAPSPPPSVPAETPEAFTRAMTEGLAALDRGAHGEARAAFLRAEAARPGTPSAADGLARAEEGLRSEALAQHRARGALAEAREDWRGAVVEYDAALKLDPQIAFAVEGMPRSQSRAELDERLAAFLKRPDRLSTEAVAREAETALDQARDARPSGPRLQEQVASLDRLVRAARSPVEVRLQSDGLTDVSVLRVGALGAFREKSLALRPGSYVVTGKRRGYRDARKTLVVTHEKSPPPLLILCDEAL